MRLAWAVVLGATVAGLLAWWLGRSPAAGSHASTDPAATGAAAGRGADDTRPTGPTLYRWRDEAGIVQITDIPPTGRSYSIVDSAALERRNTIQPNPKIAAEVE